MGSSNVTDLAEGLRSRNAELHKPSVKSVPPLNSADLPHGIVSIGGRSVELDRVAELTEDLRSHIVAWCRPSIILGTWLNSQTFRSNAAIIPLVSGTTDWLVEPFIPLLVKVIVLHDCFVIDADHPEPRRGLRSLARSGSQHGGTLTSRFAKPWQGSSWSAVQRSRNSRRRRAMMSHYRFARRARWVPHSSRISRSERHRLVGSWTY